MTFCFDYTTFAYNTDYFVFKIQIKLYNLNFGINEKIEYMGWVNEGVLNNNHPWQSYCARFMIIRGRDVLLFDTPPVSITAVLFKIHYFLIIISL